MTYDGALKRSLLDELLVIRRERGSIPNCVVRELAEGAGIHPSTLWRWVAAALEGAPEPTGCHRRKHISELSPEHIQVVFDNLGNVALAKRYLDKEFDEIAAMSLSTFRRLWRKVDPAIRAMASGGAEALLSNQLRNVYTPKGRNAIWHIDSMECPIWVVPEGSTTEVVKPWLVTVEDGYSRRIMSVLLTMSRPTSKDVVVAVADAIRVKQLSVEGGEVGGVPEVVHTDNGSEFKNNVLSQGLARLGIRRKFSYPYLKHLNGKVERLQQTIQRQLFARLPGYSQGPKSLSRKDIYGEEIAVLGERALLAYLLDWVEEYNSTHPHSALGGQSPNQVWCADQTPIRRADPEAVRLSMLEAAGTRKVGARGVFFNNRYFTAPELAPLVGQKVTLRFMPHDESFVEVFFEDEWVCTAHPHESLTDEERRLIREITRRQYSEARAYTEQAAEKRRRMAEEAPLETITSSDRRPEAEGLIGEGDLFVDLMEDGGAGDEGQ